MAICSFAIAHHLHSIRQNRTTPSWIRQLSDASVHPSWLDNIRDSVVGDCTIERVGVLIDAYEGWDWMSYVPFMAKNHAPVWFYWGQHCDRPVQNGAIEKYRPTWANIISARSMFLLHGHTMPRSERAKEAPKPQPGSHQL